MAALPHCNEGPLRSYCVPGTVLAISPCPQAAPRENSGETGPLGPKGKEKMESKHRPVHSFAHFFRVSTLCQAILYVTGCRKHEWT